MRVWAIAWDVFRRAQPRVGRGGWRAVDFVVCYGLGGFFSFFFPFFFLRISSNAHGLLQYEQHLASCTSLLVMRQGRGSEATEAVFCL